MMEQLETKYDPVADALAGIPYTDSVQPDTQAPTVLSSGRVSEEHSNNQPEQTGNDNATATEEENFSYNGYQVVRGEFFSHINEPSITFNNGKVSCNATCLKRLSTVENVQFLVNSETQKLVVRPCGDDEKDAVVWCTSKRKPKQISCKIFCAKIMELMNWNPDYRYKLLGKIIKAGDEQLILFDLTATETYRRTKTDDGKVKTARKPNFPLEWQNQFGLPFEEHRKQLQINLVDGYSVFSMQESASTHGGEKGIQ